MSLSIIDDDDDNKNKTDNHNKNYGLIFVVLVKKQQPQTNISHKVKTLLDVDCVHACLRAFKDRC